jgi:hypothetical protein
VSDLLIFVVLCKFDFYTPKNTVMRSALRAAKESALIGINRGFLLASLITAMAFSDLTAQSYDVGISEIIQPHSLVSGNFTPKVVLSNYGTATCTAATIEYSINGANVQTYNWTGSLPQNSSVVVTLTSMTPTDVVQVVSVSTDGTVNVGQVDANLGNDGYTKSVAYQANIQPSLPYHQDFDSWSPSSTSSSCGTSVSLNGNWDNADNSSTDDIDWRVGTSSTGTGSTGPSNGFGPSDNYLYTEGGQGGSKCKYMNGVAISPAFDLNDLERPMLQFSYHMYGANIGTFSVGLYTSSGDSALLYEKTGDLGNTWFTDSVSLEDWLGDTVVVSFKHYTGGGIKCDVAIDEIYIRNEACKVADSLSLTAVTHNTAAISWTSGGAYANQWDAVVVANGALPSSGVPVTLNANSHTFSSLSSNTDYDVYIREYCENNTVSTAWVGPLDVTTLCGTTTIPYSEDFASGMPACFSQSTDDDFDWSIGSGNTPTPNTGPSSASSGTYYAFLESTGQSAGAEAILNLNPMNVSSLANPAIAFYHHMYAYSDASLYLEAYDAIDDEWDVLYSYTANREDLWRPAVADLSGYPSYEVVLRFRGVLANNTNYDTCDIAIDDITFREILAPTADFRPSIFNPCLGEPVEFSIYNEYEGPNQFQWSFSPNSVSYLNGTSSTSKNPTVNFLADSIYDVQLIVCNAVACDTIFKNDYIFSAQIFTLPFTEDFEDSPQTTWNRWSRIGPVNHQWDIDSVSGTGVGAQSAYYPSYTNSNIGQRQILRSPNMYFGNVLNASLTFDHAYVRRQIGFTDSLIVYASADCGATKTRILTLGENETGSYSTTNGTFTSTTPFTPTSDEDWCFGADGGASCSVVDLTPFASEPKVMLIFEVYNNRQNNLYIDNVEVSTSSSTDTLFWMNNGWNPSAPNTGTDQFVVVVSDTQNELPLGFNFNCSKLIVEPNAHLRLTKGSIIDVQNEVIVKNGGKITIETGCTLRTSGP